MTYTKGEQMSAGRLCGEQPLPAREEHVYRHHDLVYS
jgi:hypothetical protein